VVGVEANQRINRSSAADGQYRRDFNVSKELRQQAISLFSSFFFLAKWEVEGATNTNLCRWSFAEIARSA